MGKLKYTSDGVTIQNELNITGSDSTSVNVKETLDNLTSGCVTTSDLSTLLINSSYITSSNILNHDQTSTIASIELVTDDLIFSAKAAFGYLLPMIYKSSTIDETEKSTTYYPTTYAVVKLVNTKLGDINTALEAILGTSE